MYLKRCSTNPSLRRQIAEPNTFCAERFLVIVALDITASKVCVIRPRGVSITAVGTIKLGHHFGIWQTSVHIDNGVWASPNPANPWRRDLHHRVGPALKLLHLEFIPMNVTRVEENARNAIRCDHFSDSSNVIAHGIRHDIAPADNDLEGRFGCYELFRQPFQLGRSKQRSSLAVSVPTAIQHKEISVAPTVRVIVAGELYRIRVWIGP